MIAHLYQDEYKRWKFYGIPRRTAFANRIHEGWYLYDEMTGKKKFYGGYATLQFADKRGEIVWRPFDLKTRIIYLPMTPYAELLWLSDAPKNLTKI